MSSPHINNRKAEAVDQKTTAVLLVLVVGTFLAPLDSSIVNIAMPAIAGQFHVQLSDISWVSTAYLLTSAALLLTMGRFGDIWGLRNLYAGGMAIFGIGSLACALSGSLSVLIAARVLQAVGAAMTFAAGPALITRTFPADRRGWALGFISLSVAAGLTTGPALGGLLLRYFGWPSIFLINIPIAAVVTMFALHTLPKEKPKGERFDMLGALLAAGGLLLILLGLGEAEGHGLWSSRVVVPVVLGLVFLFALVRWERRAPAPMIDLRLFDSPVFSAGIAGATLAYLSLFAVTFTMPFWLLRVVGIESGRAGLVLMITPIAMALIAPAAGRAADRIGSRWLATSGLAVQTVGLLWLSTLDADSGVMRAVFGLIVVGIGMAVFQTPNTVAVLRATPRENAGVGSAFIAEARNVGMAIGIALTAAIVGMALGGRELPPGSDKLGAELAASFSEGMSQALIAAAAICAIAVGVVWYGDRCEVESGSTNT